MHEVNRPGDAVGNFRFAKSETKYLENKNRLCPNSSQREIFFSKILNLAEKALKCTFLLETL